MREELFSYKYNSSYIFQEVEKKEKKKLVLHNTRRKEIANSKNRP
jgi:hypothetical protein